MNLKQFDTLIFDLGGVIINLDYHATSKAFISLGIKDFDELYSQANQTGLFDELETGKISPFLFINKILDFLPKGTTPNQVVHAWNAMIKDFPIKRLELLQKLSSTHRLLLFSNTNRIHEEKVRLELKKVSENSLESYFDRTYLSHTFGHRKPHAESFTRLLEDAEVQEAGKTLFIDDSPQHIEGAKKAGLKAIHLTGELLELPIFLDTIQPEVRP